MEQIRYRSIKFEACCRAGFFIAIDGKKFSFCFYCKVKMALAFPVFPANYLIFALDFGGNGITFSLIAAEILTDNITGRKNNDEDIFF